MLDLARAGDDLLAAVSFHGVLDALPAHLVAKHIPARMLICDGDLDPFNDDTRRHEMVQQLRAACADFELVSYSRAKHGFTCPAQRLNQAEGFAYDASAAARSWEAARTFLTEAFEAHRHQS